MKLTIESLNLDVERTPITGESSQFGSVHQPYVNHTVPAHGLRFHQSALDLGQRLLTRDLSQVGPHQSAAAPSHVARRAVAGAEEEAFTGCGITGRVRLRGRRHKRLNESNNSSRLRLAKLEAWHTSIRHAIL